MTENYPHLAELLRAMAKPKNLAPAAAASLATAVFDVLAAAVPLAASVRDTHFPLQWDHVLAMHELVVAVTQTQQAEFAKQLESVSPSATAETVDEVAASAAALAVGLRVLQQYHAFTYWRRNAGASTNPADLLATQQVATQDAVDIALPCIDSRLLAILYGVQAPAAFLATRGYFTAAPLSESNPTLCTSSAVARALCRRASFVAVLLEAVALLRAAIEENKWVLGGGTMLLLFCIHFTFFFPLQSTAAAPQGAGAAAASGVVVTDLDGGERRLAEATAETGGQFNCGIGQTATTATRGWWR